MPQSPDSPTPRPVCKPLPPPGKAAFCLQVCWGKCHPAVRSTDKYIINKLSYTDRKSLCPSIVIIQEVRRQLSPQSRRNPLKVYLIKDSLPDTSTAPSNQQAEGRQPRQGNRGLRAGQALGRKRASTRPPNTRTVVTDATQTATAVGRHLAAQG